jgi:hypothetical protein
MGILRKNRSVALLIAVTASAPFLLRCGSDSGTSGTGGGGGGDYGGNAGSSAGGTQPIAGSVGFPVAGSGGHAEGGTGGDEGVAGSPATDSGGEAGAPIAGNGGAGGSSDSGGGGTGGGAMGGSAGATGGSAGMSGSGGASGAGGVSGASGVGGASGAGGGSGVGGTGGASGSGGAGSGTPGHLTLSATTLEFSAICPNPPTATPQTVTLTNTGGTALTWTATFDSSHIFDAPDASLSPSTSTLAPGAHIDVTVSPATLEEFQYVMGTTLALGDLSITTDVTADTAHVVTLSEDAYGYFAGPPDLTTFGTVTVGDAVQKTIHGIASPASPGGIVLQSSNPDFALSGLVPSPIDASWTLTFQPSAAGLESTTLTAGDMFGHCIYPPNTFVVTGTGAYGSCAGLQGIKCAVDATCQSGTCALIATITPLTINAQVGVPYTGFVGLINTFNEVTQPEFDVVIDYGDGHTSESTVNGDTTGIANGDHTYTQAGTFNGSMTITELANGLSTSAVIPVIVTN